MSTSIETSKPRSPSPARRSVTAPAPRDAHARRRGWFGGAALALMLLCAGQTARATDLCVSTTQQLLSAFALSEISQQGLRIKIVQGTYNVGSIGLQILAPIEIRGGYTSNCAGRTVKASNTVISFGLGNSGYFRQGIGSPVASLTIDGLTLRDAKYISLAAGDLSFYGGTDDAGNVTLSHARITNISSTDPSAVSLSTVAGYIDVEDVLFDNFTAQSCGITVSMDNQAATYFNFVTADLSNGNDLCVVRSYQSDDNVFNFTNSILWASDGTLVAIRGFDGADSGEPLIAYLENSILHTWYGYGTPAYSNTVNADPKWVNPDTNDYHLQSTSPGVNSGTTVVNGGYSNLDVDGVGRTKGSAPDRGAYESPYSDLGSFIVINTNDSGPGSLRQAIIDANSLPDPALIEFSIPGACPRVIALKTVLPFITGPTIIDGYTQPYATENDDPDAFNAKLCVVVKPASGSLAIGFGVKQDASNASLTLRGLGLGGFAQDVILVGGKNHVIAGNQIGGSVGGVSLPGAQSYGVSIGVNAGGSLIVGGPNYADRNVIGGAGAGINIQSTVVSEPDKCQIVGNLIGVGPDGHSPVPNTWGVDLAGDGCSVVGNRIVGNSKDGIWINGGNNNVIQRNIIGVDVNGNGAFNAGAGIKLSYGSANKIGADAISNVSGSILGNTVRFMVAGGIVDTENEYSFNAIRTNLVYDNGIDTNGMDIDLAPLGPTGNDGDDLDQGPNGLQNFPLITALDVKGTGTGVPASLNATLTTQPGTYKVDAYFSNSCSSNGRGHAQAYLGATTVVVAQGALSKNFAMNVTLPNLGQSSVLSLTATDSLDRTSELSTCYLVSQLAKPNDLFKDSFD